MGTPKICHVPWVVIMDWIWQWGSWNETFMLLQTFLKLTCSAAGWHYINFTIITFSIRMARLIHSTDSCTAGNRAISSGCAQTGTGHSVLTVHTQRNEEDQWTTPSHCSCLNIKTSFHCKLRNNQERQGDVWACVWICSLHHEHAQPAG